MRDDILQHLLWRMFCACFDSQDVSLASLLSLPQATPAQLGGGVCGRGQAGGWFDGSYFGSWVWFVSIHKLGMIYMHDHVYIYDIKFDIFLLRRQSTVWPCFFFSMADTPEWTIGLGPHFWDVPAVFAATFLSYSVFPTLVHTLWLGIWCHFFSKSYSRNINTHI